MRRSNLVHHFTERADLPGESLPSQTILEIYGENRILIENHQGVTEYSDQQIGVRVHYGSVCVSGSGLHLCRITGCQLVIAGRIEQVKLFSGNTGDKTNQRRPHICITGISKCKYNTTGCNYVR